MASSTPPPWAPKDPGPGTGPGPRPPPRVSGITWTPRRRAVAEFAGGVLTLAVWLGAEATGLKLVAFFLLLFAWVAYFTARAVWSPRLWLEWGIRVTGWRRAARWHLGSAVAALGVVALLGGARATLVVPDHAWLLVVLYPPWAFCQQFLLQNAVVANARVLGVPRQWLPLVGMLTFAAAHTPDLPMMGLTALGGLLWTWLWLRAPNLWLLALGHAIVGSAAFLWVLGRDPLLEFPQIARLVEML